MKTIGNVVCNNNIRIEDGLKRYNNMEEINESLPTLIVGIENAKRNITNFNILNKKVKNDNIWWTFKRSERLVEYKIDMESFYAKCIELSIDNVDYVLIDVINLNRQRIKGLLKLLKSNSKKYFYNDYNKFLFMYLPSLNKMYGISLTTLNFFGFSSKNILKHVNNDELIKDFTRIPLNVRKLVGEYLHKLIIIYDYFNV